MAAIRAKLIRIRDNKLFEVFVISVIVLSGLVVGARTYSPDPSILRGLNVLDYLVTGFFLVEILIRMASERSLLAFFRKGWNTFDFLVVAVSLVPMGWAHSVMLARLLRIFRVLRLISFIPELRLLVNALVKALPRLGYVAIMMFVIFYIYGAVGSIAFRNINAELWGNISVAMLTLFRVATFEDWTDVMYETMDVYPLSWLYYVTFIFLAAFVFLNMVIGIILEVMQREHEQYDRQQAAEAVQDGVSPAAGSGEPPSRDVIARLDRIERLLEQRL
ncbi:ion transporter [Thiohalorhabdus sp. Cl-TMA]|uniref:Ion transporter n=1 Tax=Thiohalorhabdus methylotrophus TaxID=3242694 RepID=A0ABV4TXV9_9GAMM